MKIVIMSIGALLCLTLSGCCGGEHADLVVVNNSDRDACSIVLEYSGSTETVQAADGSALLKPGQTYGLELEEGEVLEVAQLAPNQHFTQPPPRFTEASLIKELEENGIGRPSTYASTLSTILQRGYVEREQKALKPTALGEVTTKLMKEQFKDIVDLDFTAGMEQRLDEVEDGKIKWEGVLSSFYGDFADTLKQAEKNMEGTRMKVPDEETDVVCELCGRKMVIKHGRFGKFLACPGFPECRNAKKLVQETPGSCPVCGKKVVTKKTKKGRTFYGCSGYPDCTFMTWDVPLEETCPKCGSTLFRTTGKMKRIHCLKEGCGFEKAAPGKKESSDG